MSYFEGILKKRMEESCDLLDEFINYLSLTPKLRKEIDEQELIEKAKNFINKMEELGVIS